MSMAHFTRCGDHEAPKGIYPLGAGDQGGIAPRHRFIGQGHLKLQGAWSDLHRQPGALIGGQLHYSGELLCPQPEQRRFHAHRLLACHDANLGGAESLGGGNAEAITAATVGHHQFGLLCNSKVLLETAPARVDQAHYKLAQPRVVIVGENLHLAAGSRHLQVIGHHCLSGELSVPLELGDHHAPGLVQARERGRKNSYRATGVHRGAVGAHCTIETGMRQSHPRQALR